jgi:hypothetical protein
MKHFEKIKIKIKWQPSTISNINIKLIKHFITQFLKIIKFVTTLRQILQLKKTHIFFFTFYVQLHIHKHMNF